ncbi:MAG TPA: hypothetical protein VF161_12895 [Steroidobacteraceae bacterium]
MAGTEGKYETITIVAANDFRVAGALHKCVDADADFSAAGGATALGLVKSQANSGQFLTVGYSGVMKFYAGAAVTAGAQLTPAASGFLVAVASGSNRVVGRAVEAGNSGDLVKGIFDFAAGGSVN